MNRVTILQWIPAFIGLLIYIAAALYLLTSRTCSKRRGGAALRCGGVVMLLVLLQFPLAVLSTNRGIFWPVTVYMVCLTLAMSVICWVLWKHFD